MLELYAPTLYDVRGLRPIRLLYLAGVNKFILSRLGNIFLAPRYISGERTWQTLHRVGNEAS